MEPTVIRRAAGEPRRLAPAEPAEELHEGSIPPVVTRHLEALYQSPYSVPEYFALDGMDANAHAYVLREGGRVRDVLCFVRSGRVVRVLNEVVPLERDTLERFARAVFARYPRARTIRLTKVRADLTGSPLPSRCLRVTSDHVIALPGTPEAYRMSLGRSTRGNLNNLPNRLKKAGLVVAVETMRNSRIPRNLVRRVLELNRERMMEKGRRPAISDAGAALIERYCHSRGVVTVIRIDGEVAAGSICYQVGRHVYGQVIAHAARYNAYRIGFLCIYESIRAAIEDGAEAFHLQWGDAEYKRHLGGTPTELCDLRIYRSPLDRRLGGLEQLPARLLEKAKDPLRRLLEAQRKRPGPLLPWLGARWRAPGGHDDKGERE